MKSISDIKQREVFVEWVREMLDDQTINGDDNFLDIGGNSLLAIELIARYEYGVKISMLNLLQSSIDEALINSQTV